jgi:chitinase
VNPNGNATANLGVRIGYYDASAASRQCNAMQPENLAAGVLTHINVAYETVNENGEITDQNGQIMARITRLRRRYNGLRVNVVLGGWEFNNPYSDNPETIERWANVVSSVPNQQTYINSLVNYMHKYSLNGVDIGKTFCNRAVNAGD